MSNQPDSEFVEASEIAIRIGELINSIPDRTRGGVLIATMMVVADTIGSIGCRDCRAKAAGTVKRMMPGFIEQAMMQAHSVPSNHAH